jgi:hypothetical protein
VRRVLIAGLIALAVLFLAACGDDSSIGGDGGSTMSDGMGGGGMGSGGASGPTSFELREWAVTPPTTPLQAGAVEVTATNTGSETHELVVVRGDAASLPTLADGSVDEDAIPEADKAGEIPDIAPGASGTATLDLPAGDYVAFCNIVDQMGDGGMGTDGMGDGGMGGGGTGNGGMGHVHYRLGMVTQFTVT